MISEKFVFAKSVVVRKPDNGFYYLEAEALHTESRDIIFFLYASLLLVWSTHVKPISVPKTWKGWDDYFK